MKVTALFPLLLISFGCASDFHSVPETTAIEDGSTSAVVQISSSPTEAWIFIDGNYIGVTPIETRLTYAAGTRFIEVVAAPGYSAQVRQVKRIALPPLPHVLFFDMNNPPASAASR